MKQIIINNPNRLVFGPGSLAQLANDFIDLGLKRLFVITLSVLNERIEPVIEKIKANGIEVEIEYCGDGEPSYTDFKKILNKAKEFNADSIAGIGGGSVMDVAKVIAALIHSEQNLESIAGIDQLNERNTYLICVPTTSGTGSEVSPNAILINENNEKTGFISKHLVPDAAYIDPNLTIDLPPKVTAYTGIDALTHCIEAYANKFAHPVIDLYALQGIKLISENLLVAIKNSKNIDARINIALGSLYGGICLGPVNTAAVHALAYPVGSDFKIAHGISNSLLLPYVMEYNLDYAVDRYADIALALGAKTKTSKIELAKNGISIIKNFIRECDIPGRLSEIGIPENSIDELTKSAFQVKRLLNNNVRELSIEDIKTIYHNAY